MKKYNLSLLILFLFSSPLMAQNGDYDQYPKLDFIINHLELQLSVEESGSVNGIALYTITPRISGVQQIIFDAVRLEVEDVSWNGESAEFEFQDDHLIVNLQRSLPSGTSGKLEISYSSDPKFGVHTNDRGTIWTSLLPATVRHWLPVIDHPRIEFTTDIRFSFPSGKKVVMNGRSGELQIASVQKQRIRFTTENPVPASMLSFAVGDFDQTQSSIGIRQFILSAEDGLLDSDEKSALIEAAYEAFQHAERITGTGYPYRTLNLIVLEDDRGETKNYAAGVVYAWKTKGDLAQQIKSGVLAQWFGVTLREEQWNDAEAIHLMHASLLAGMRGGPGLNQVDSDENSIYQVFNRSNRNAWLQTYRSPDHADFKWVLDSIRSEILKKNPGVVNWNDFATYIYTKTGQPFFEKPVLTPPAMSDEMTYKYDVNYDFDEEEGQITFRFSAQGAYIDELVSVSVTEYHLAETKTRELTFTGRQDAVILSTGHTIENVVLEIKERDDVQLNETKPFLFWIHQLRNATDNTMRQKAAAGLSQHSDNPDIQLALLDLFRAEQDAAVRAEILRTISNITRGGIGTDQIFLPRTSAQNPVEVQLAASEALGAFRDNDQVVSQLQTIILRAESMDVRSQAVKSLGSAASPERLKNAVETLVTREAVQPLVPALLWELADAGKVVEAVSMAGTFLNPSFPYAIRSQVLNLLIQYDESQEAWQRRLNTVLKDNDPRIRLTTATALSKVPSGIRNQILENFLDDEYDIRVKSALR